MFFSQRLLLHGVITLNAKDKDDAKRKINEFLEDLKWDNIRIRGDGETEFAVTAYEAKSDIEKTWDD